MFTDISMTPGTKVLQLTIIMSNKKKNLSWFVHQAFGLWISREWWEMWVTISWSPNWCLSIAWFVQWPNIDLIYNCSRWRKGANLHNWKAWTRVSINYQKRSLLLFSQLTDYLINTFFSLQKVYFLKHEVVWATCL